jgi:hypothetical protein
MATLTTKLTLTSSNATSDSLNLSVTDTLTTTNPQINVARISCPHDSVTQVLTTDQSAITYVYLKNTDSTNIITVKTDGAVSFSDLGPGEFIFFPLKGAVGVEVQANTAACIMEYGYWTKG